MTVEISACSFCFILTLGLYIYNINIYIYIFVQCLHIILKKINKNHKT